MRDITGAPSYEYVIKEEPNIFDKIREATDKNWVITVSTNESDDRKMQQLKDLGLMSNHIYSVNQVARVKNKDGKVVQLCKLRNPWGKFEWNGDWSDDSDCWTALLNSPSAGSR